MRFHHVTIPGGFKSAAGWERSLWARGVCGADEVFLAEEMRDEPPAARATALLERTVTLDDGSVPAGREFCRELSAGDREALLLQLRRLTFGDRMDCALHCPSCREKLDLELSVGSLLLEPYPDNTLDGEHPIGGYQVRLRRLNGADLEDLAMAARRDSESAELAAVRRCVLDARNSEGRRADLPETVLHDLSSVLAGMDPQAELNLEASCPVCGEPWTQPLDAMQYLQSEMAQDLDGLFGDVHRIAFHYHWSEADILSLPAERRARYLAMIAAVGKPA